MKENTDDINLLSIPNMFRITNTRKKVKKNCKAYLTLFNKRINILKKFNKHLHF